MRQAQAGDRVAYRQVLIGVTPYLRRAAGRFFARPADIDDAVQDILMTLHTVRHTYDPDRPFRPWLAGIARYRLVDRLRGVSRVAAREVAITLEHETFASPASNTDTDAWDAHTVRQAVAALPAGQRTAIELVKLQEMSLKEAASASGMSVTALKVATHRGIQSLRRLLGGHPLL
ncbi:MAG: sigma-70 family RNA polymerase sigma factor [Proteobacteria bacterium]|nr:sigma-70 family RNA polymerase sigma factor [Pseudomonadota bacterium]